MSNILKWFLGLVAFLFLVLLAAIIIVPLVFDPNDYKDEIAEAVKKETGRDLHIGQPIDFSLFPWIGLKLGDVSLSNAPGFNGEPFAQIREIDLKVALKPLFNKNIVVDTVLIDGLRLNLIQDKKGNTNWQDLQKESAPVTKDKPEDVDVVVTVPMDLQVQGVEVSDGRISLQDHKTGDTLLVDRLAFNIGAFEFGEPVEMKTSMRLASTADELEGALDLSGEINVSKEGSLLINGLDLSLDAKGKNLPAKGVSLNLAADLGLDPQSERLELEDLSISANGLEITGKLSASEINTQPVAKGTFSLQHRNLRQLLHDLEVSLETADPEVLKSLDANIGINYSHKGLQIEPLQLKLDDTRLEGTIQVTDFTNPALKLRLEVDALDLDRYLPQTAEAETPQQPVAGAAVNPFEPLRTLELDGRLTIGQLIMAKARMENIQVTATSRNGVLSLKPISADFYEGKFMGSAELDARGKLPKYKVSKDLMQVAVGALLKDVTGEDTVTGTGNIQVQSHTQGLTKKQQTKHLNGKVMVSLKDGAYKGINVAQTIRQAMALKDGRQSVTDEPLQTDFSSLSGSAVIRDGIVYNKDLQALSPLLRIDGKGNVDLNKEQVDYLLTTELVGTLEGQGGKTASELAGVAIPVRLKGHWSSPSPSVDLQAALEANAKKELDKQKDKLLEKAQKELGGDLGDALKGFLKKK